MDQNRLRRHLFFILGVSVIFMLCIPLFNIIYNKFIAASFQKTQIELTIFTVEPDKGKSLTPYGLFSVYLARMLEDEFNIKVNNKGARGSLTGIIGVENNDNSIALAQADVLHHYVNGGHNQFPLSKSETKVRVISRLFPEWVTIKKISDNRKSRRNKSGYRVINSKNLHFSDMKLCGGVPGTGKLVTAMTVIKLLGENNSELTNCPQEYVFDVSSPSKSRICGYYDKGKIHNRIFFDKGSVDVISSAYPRVFSSHDPKFYSMYYGGPKVNYLEDCHEVQNKEHSTSSGRTKSSEDKAYVLSVDALLIANKSVKPEIINYILKLLGELDKNNTYNNGEACDSVVLEATVESKPENKTRNFSALDSKWSKAKSTITGRHIIGCSKYKKYDHDIKNYHNKNKNNFAFSKMDISYHKTVQTEMMGWGSKIIVGALSGVVLYLLFIFMLVIYIINYTRQYKSNFVNKEDWLNDIEGLFIKDSAFLKFIIFFLGIHVVVIAVILAGEVHHAENLGTGETIGSLLDAFKWLLANIVGTTSSVSLHSPVALLAVGVLKTGYAFSSLGLGYRLVMGKNILGQIMAIEKNSVAIFGKSHLYEKIVTEISAIYDSNVKISHYLLPIVENVPCHSEADIPDIDLTDQWVVRNFSTIKAVIVLADEKAAKENYYSGVDSFTIAQVNYLLKVLKEVQVIVEVQHPDTKCALENMRAKNLEIICVNYFGVELIAQSIDRNSIVRVYDELLKTTSDSNKGRYGDNEIYYDNVSPASHGKDYRDLARDGRIPIGIKRGDRVLINPIGNEAIIQYDDNIKDLLIVISRESKTV